MLLHVYGIKHNSSVDGPGLRYAIFVQGCPRSCPGCHNPESQSQNIKDGIMIEIDNIVDEIISDPLINGVSFSGGEPFLYPEICAEIIRKVKEQRANLSFWTWSGYTFEEIIEDKDKKQFLSLVDVLVDGPFIKKEKDTKLLWRGSANQRIIDVSQSIKKKTIVILPDSTWYVPDKTPKIKLHN